MVLRLIGRASAYSRSSRPRRTMDICLRSQPIGKGLKGVLTFQQLAETPTIPIGTRGALKKTQGKLLRSSQAASGRAVAFSAGGDGGPREHDYLERWCGGRALPLHRGELLFFWVHETF